MTRRVRLSEKQHHRDGGLECRLCGCRHFNVIWIRHRPDGTIRRRRQCRHCGWQLTTTELPIRDQARKDRNQRDA